jgi:hypothetical protein
VGSENQNWKFPAVAILFDYILRNLAYRMSQKNIYYSDKYYDNEYEYR